MIENISEMQSNLLTLKKEISDSRENLKQLKLDHNMPLDKEVSVSDLNKSGHLSSHSKAPSRTMK